MRSSFYRKNERMYVIIKFLKALSRSRLLISNKDYWYLKLGFISIGMTRKNINVFCVMLFVIMV